jgi:hypothetical protein
MDINIVVYIYQMSKPERRRFQEEKREVWDERQRKKFLEDAALDAAKKASALFGAEGGRLMHKKYPGKASEFGKMPPRPGSRRRGRPRKTK